MKQLLSFSLAAALLAGCTMAPKYERPAAPVAQTWATNAAAAAVPSVPAADLAWQNFFQDPRLLKLIEVALTNSLDLRVAALNVETARAQYRIQRSSLLPTVNANAGGSRSRTPADIAGAPDAIHTTTYSVSASVTSYELDFFGRVRSLKAQALNKYLATDESRKSVQISLISEVAIQYLTERQLDEQLLLTRQTLQAVEASYDLNKRSYENGVASELDLRSSEAQVQTARANLATLTQQRAQSENALVLLLGCPLPASLPPPQPLGSQKLIADLSPGQPADLLQRRPDIRAAELLLKAVNANIGAARAAFFPRVFLTGSIGATSLKVEDLFTGPQKAWSFAPQITVPIFDAGNNKASLDVAKLSKQIEVANYQKAIQTAFREVSDALVARTSLNDRIQAEQGLVAAQQKRYDLAELRYRNGVDSYQTVLQAQQDLYSAQKNLIQSQTDRLSNLVTLYKTLGGGWTEPRR
jgi:multidrug efflux system outer membrane protein